MARKLRLEYPGAAYHVINRGNYRADIFANDKTKWAFEECLFEACKKSNWTLHAFVLMCNHFHLALETPDGNLVAGMQWLQGTFGCRFNRLRKECGHIFQGRYKALLIGEGRALSAVCDYIHLNPVRAGVVPVEALRQYRYASYWYLRNPKQRPGFLRPQTALASVGIADNQVGWDCYDRFLEQQVAQGVADRDQTYINLSKGWAIGPDDFKAALVAQHKLAGLVRAWGKSGAAEIRYSNWETSLKRALQALHYSAQDAALAKKSAPWKLAIASWMKTRTQASNGWLSQNLFLGAPKAFSHNLSVFRRNAIPSDPSWRRLSVLSVT
jgi:REP element-mobilizing transposase RayT